ncbi:hypothetical protein FRC02_005696 [Tulasnella sp. 418]|nr:hypothetical protein FRC02_005696 [Tulasnella sp. 418]
MKGWASLVEEKIEKARSSGVFNNVEGRGKPIQRHPDESNPFIAREEFLMNRILKRNEAAPPWVETQGDLEQAIRTFRAIISSSWVRRATRTILSDLPPPPYPRTLNNVTVESISKLRDKEWEEKEASYHEAALKEVNDQIRRHNGMAPFSARRPYLMLKYELERCYEKNAEDVLKNLEETLSREPLNRKPGAKRSGDAASASGNLGEFTTFSLWDTLRRAALRLFGYGSSPPGRSASNQTPSTSP